MRISRRFMALALTLCLALTMIPGMAMAADVIVADADGLTNAITNAAAGETTITLTADITTASALIINKNGCDITLDLGGKTLTARINLKGGNLTIKNGTVSLPESDSQPLNVYGHENSGSETTKLTVAENAKIIGAYGICLFDKRNADNSHTYKAYNAQIDIYGTIKAERSAVFVSGNIHEGDSVVNIYSGADLTGGPVDAVDGVGVAVNGYATVNIKDGAKVQGPTAVEVRAGKLNITGGTFTATGDPFSAVANNSGTTTTGAAVAVSSYNISDIEVNISGGTFKGATAFGETYTKDGELEPGRVNISITGGDFTGDISSENSEGFISGGTFVLDFGTVKVGYAQPAAKVVSIKSFIEYDDFPVTVVVPAGYEISKEENGVFDSQVDFNPTRDDNVYIRPKAGLGAGNYTGSVNVSFTNGANGSVPPETNNELVLRFAVETPYAGGSGISVKYTGGNGFSTSNSAVPTGVEIDNVPVSFTGDGRNFTVSCIKPDAKWVTVRWNSTSVTTNFTPDAAAYCSPTNIPKTGDASLAAFVVMAIVAAAGAMRRK